MLSNRLRGVSIFSLVCVMLAVMLLAGCSSTSKKDETPANSSMTLSASPTTVNTGSTSVVEAAITAGGSPVADQVVTFVVSPSTVGYFTPASDTTDATGTAAAVFTATNSGAATITATVSGSSLSRSVGMQIEEGGPATGTGNVTISVTPSLLLANGADTAQVRITVRDQLGQFAPDSTVVKIVAGEKFVDVDGNGYWSNGIDSLVYDANNNGNWDALGLIPSNAYVTGGAGQVTVNYISGSDALTVYVRATVDGAGITGFGETPLQLSPNASIASIYLSSDSMNLAVKQTGGIETSLIRALCFDPGGNRVPEGLAVNFIITDGPGGGEHLANTGYGPYQAVTNGQGMATVSIHSGTRSGTIRIRAWSDTVLSNATQVMVSAGPPAHIVVGADTCNVPYWNVVAGVNRVTAVVSDVYLNPVNDSTVVYFTTDEGTMKSHEKRTENHDGIATSVWYSGNNVDTADGIVKVICETSGGTVADTSWFYNSGPCGFVEIPVYETSVLADGRSKFEVLVQGWDINHNPMPYATSVFARANLLAVQEGGLTDGCNTSSSVLEVGPVKLDQDYVMTGGNDNGVGAIDIVTYRVGFAAASFPCSLLTGPASRTASVIDGPTNVETAASIDISAIIKDRYGNPLGDHTLVMTATGGLVAGASQETNSYGEAFGFRWTAPASEGTHTISITDTDPRGGIILQLTVTVAAP
ncbi:MAG: hypothetical protein IPH75_15865 [bacterium]|nr:hypothetical protein [bacterium]